MRKDNHDDVGPKIAGSEISRLRLDAGLTQFEVARRTGVSVSTIYRAERGDSSVGPPAIAKIAAVLGVPMSNLYSGPLGEITNVPGLVRTNEQHDDIIGRLNRIQTSIDGLRDHRP